MAAVVAVVAVCWAGVSALLTYHSHTDRTHTTPARPAPPDNSPRPRAPPPTTATRSPHQYDDSCATYSPDGRVFQVEYAEKAIDQSGCVARVWAVWCGVGVEGWVWA